MHEPIAFCTLAIVLLTCWISFLGFRDERFEGKYIFCPEDILAYKEFYRLISSAFLHGDWFHLLFNMMSLYMFGSYIELVFGIWNFLTIYFGAVLGGSLLSLYLH